MNIFPPDGRDFILAILAMFRKDRTVAKMEVKATVYITGANASAGRAKELNALAKNTFKTKVATLKNAAENGAILYQNGEVVDYSFNMKNYKLYPNHYLVLTSDGRYTKHYFDGSTRIASRIATWH